jgi:hypothetical protein
LIKRSELVCSVSNRGIVYLFRNSEFSVWFNRAEEHLQVFQIILGTINTTKMKREVNWYAA